MIIDWYVRTMLWMIYLPYIMATYNPLDITKKD